MYSFLQHRSPFICLGLVILLSGCAQMPPAFQYRPSVEADAEMVWPAPPEQARYRYVGQLTGEDNIYIPGEKTANIAVRFGRWLVGLVGHSPNPVLLQRPQAVITGPDGRIYVTDVSRQAVYVFDPVAASLNVWEYAADGLRFELPIGMAIGLNGELLVADASLKTVARLGPDGVPVGHIGRDKFEHPAGVVRDPERGRVYVSDRGAGLIKVFADDGRHLFDIGEFGEAPGQFNGPTYLAWHDDTLYVTDTLNSRVQRFTPDGDYVSAFGRRGLYLGDLPRPKGVTVDNAGNIYVVESYYDYLLVFNQKGELLLPIGGTGHEIGSFYLPAGVWADNNDQIYVADMFNGRVMIFKYLGDLDGSDVTEGRNSVTGAADSL